MPLDARTLPQDRLPHWAEEPPAPASGSLVPGSQFHEEQWIMAAGMLAHGSSFLHVARAMGCSRTTLWRAYYGSKDFRIRVWWEREALNREAELRLASLRALVAEQIERLVSAGDPPTVRWLAERLGLFAGLDAPPRPAHRGMPAPAPAPTSPPRPDPEVASPVPAGPDVERSDEHPGTPPAARPASAPISAPAAAPDSAPTAGWNTGRKMFHDVPSSAPAAAAPVSAPGGADGRRLTPPGSAPRTSAPTPSGSALVS
ncbi:hypothetical protein VY88_32430 [Azospirillum thiophilum]|uniref:Uncharacterized protein n=1 Tax=Azospirillum thiophilum TaxID=528244 RepID=A0AAC8VZU3_9PROT|nr:hypothetical protein [Azospirillum thiophilum]ALG72437.1 hypothetical protein AL072_15145 [Azospirillum thiophilum]KJR61397.1 hypothetical protein VY88_32430 [Azospirillum thiophilum]